MSKEPIDTLDPIHCIQRILSGCVAPCALLDYPRISLMDVAYAEKMTGSFPADAVVGASCQTTLKSLLIFTSSAKQT
jgi:hypothetical protein